MNGAGGPELERLISGVRRRLWCERARVIVGRGALCAGGMLLIAGLAHRLIGFWSLREAAALAALPVAGALLAALVQPRPGTVAAARVADRALDSDGLLLAAVDQSALPEGRRAAAAALVLARAERLAASVPSRAIPLSTVGRRDGLALTLALSFAVAGVVMLGGPGAVGGAGPVAAPRPVRAPTSPPGPVSRAQQSLSRPGLDGSRGVPAPPGVRLAEDFAPQEPARPTAASPHARSALPPPLRNPRSTAASPAGPASPTDAGDGVAGRGDRTGDGAGAAARRAAVPGQPSPPELRLRFRDLAGGGVGTVVVGGETRAPFPERVARGGAVAAARPDGVVPLNSLPPGVRAYADAYLALLGREP